MTKILVRSAAALVLALGAGRSLAAPANPQSDLEMHLGSFAIGWYGATDVPVANAQPGGTAAAPAIVCVTGSCLGDPFFRNTVAAPAVGVRYWFARSFLPFARAVGVDGAIGFASRGGGGYTSTAGAVTVNTDYQSQNALMLHVGLPMALATFQHVAFEVTPELNWGWGWSTAKSAAVPPVAQVDLSGTRFDVGARAGIELFFGFIGVPQLSLEASVGIAYQHLSWTATQGGNKESDSQNSFATAVYSSPWDIFRTTVAARYYF